MCQWVYFIVHIFQNKMQAFPSMKQKATHTEHFIFTESDYKELEKYKTKK